VAIIQVGQNPASTAYIAQKKKFAESLDISVEHSVLEDGVTEQELIQTIEKYNTDDTISGIVLQLPLPTHIDEDVVIHAIGPAKDIDGLTPASAALIYNGEPGIVPATARGIMELLEYYNIPVAGKNCVVIGRSRLAGIPTAFSLLARDATVTIAHSKTEHLADLTKQADIVVIATGVPRMLTSDYVSSKAVVIDIGITRVDVDGGQSLVGDADFKSLDGNVAALTPVPGGVGQLTVAALFENLFDLYDIRHHRM